MQTDVGGLGGVTLSQPDFRQPDFVKDAAADVPFAPAVPGSDGVNLGLGGVATPLARLVRLQRDSSLSSRMNSDRAFGRLVI